MLQLKRLLCIVVGLAVTSAALAGPAMLWNNGPNVKPTSSQAQIYNNSGTVSLPSYSFGSQTTTGMSLPSANNLALSAGGVQGFNLTNAGVTHLGSTGDSARLGIKCLSASDLTCLAIEDSGSTKKYYLSTGPTYFVLYDGSFDYLFASSGNLGVGNSTPDYLLDINASSTDTPSTFVKNDGAAAVAVQNKSNVAGNVSPFVSANFNGQPDAVWFGVHDVHSNTNQYGHWEGYTWANGIRQQNITISPSGVDIYQNLRVRGLNVPALIQADASGNITTTALTNGQLHIGSTGAAPVAATLTAGAGISITNGAGTISIAASGVPAANRLTKTADYTLASTDNSIWCDATNNNVRLTLPSSTSAGSGARYRITKIDSSVHVCSVVSAGASDVFYMFGTSLSDASISITDPGTSAEFEANGGTAYATE